MTFKGFPPGKLNTAQVPTIFFKELLPKIDDLDEFKVTLYAIWQINQKEGEIRYLREEDFLGDLVFMQGMGASQAAQTSAVRAGLERALNRGTLLKASLPEGDGQLNIYFFNSPRGQAAVQSVKDGSWRPSDGDLPAATLNQEQPNTFTLYEENIGPLTPLIADTLRDAEKEFPEAWIRQAVEIAVQNALHVFAANIANVTFVALGHDYNSPLLGQMTSFIVYNPGGCAATNLAAASAPLA